MAPVKHQTKVLVEGSTAHTIRLHDRHKLGVHKEVKSENVFKGKLTELGNSEATADLPTKQLVTWLAVNT